MVPTVLALQAYALGLLAFMAIKVLAMQHALEAAAFRPAIQHDSKRRWVAPVLRLRLEGSPGALAQQMEWIVFQAVRTLGWEGPQFTARFFGKFAPGGEQRWREATRPAK